MAHQIGPQEWPTRLAHIGPFVKPIMMKQQNSQLELPIKIANQMGPSKWSIRMAL